MYHTVVYFTRQENRYSTPLDGYPAEMGGITGMNSKKFAQIRHHLGKTQTELADLLCVSPKAIQSFEQGWRRIPASAERQLLMLLSLEKRPDENSKPCWETVNCPPKWRDKCIVWEHKAGRNCWFFSGTYCQGLRQQRWEKKMELCRQCEVFHKAFPSFMREG